MTTAEPAPQKNDAADQAAGKSDLSTSTYRMARRFLATNLVRGILFLVVGLLMSLWPDIALGLIKWLMIVLLLIQGVLLGIEGTQRLGDDENVGAIVRYGLVLVAFAALIGLLFWPGATTKVVLNLVAVWALVSGAVQMYNAFRRYRADKPGWDWEITIGALWVFFGATILIKPLSNIAAVTAGLSVFLIVTGIVLLVSAWSVATQRQRARAASEAPRTGPAGPPPGYGAPAAGGANVGDIPTTPNRVVSGPR